MLLVYSQWDCNRYYFSWKVKVINRKFLIYQLCPVEQIIKDKDYLLLPTPTAHLSQENGCPGDWRRHDNLTCDILMLEKMPQQTGKVKAEFIEEMMGYPKGWTQLEKNDLNH